MAHDDDVREDTRHDMPGGRGVGTDGSLHSPHEPVVDHGADRSAEESDGVGTDGSLMNPDKDLTEHGHHHDVEHGRHEVERDRHDAECGHHDN